MQPKQKLHTMILTEQEFNRITNGIKYWNNRWNYIGHVVNIVNTLQFNNSIEVGTNGVAIISDSLKIESENQFDLDSDNYPFNTDLFIALQVFEHLKYPAKAFENVKKTCKQAIISLPFEWICPADPMHHMITKDKILSWFKMEANRELRVASRIILYYKFR